MTLSHYAEKPVVLVDRSYNQPSKPHFKPNGLWVSVDGDDDWMNWCKREGFRTETLRFRHVVSLADRAKILNLNTEKAIRTFTVRFQVDYPGISSYRQIDWQAVSSKWQGIIIAPYCWSLRLDPKCSWYYSWDCASGCIWDLTALSSFALEVDRPVPPTPSTLPTSSR